MTLKEFIKNTIYDINIAIEETYKETGKYYMIGESHAKDKPISFDIAVTQSAEGSSGGQGGIQVWGIGIGGKKNPKKESKTSLESNSASSSRILIPCQRLRIT